MKVLAAIIVLVITFPVNAQNNGLKLKSENGLFLADKKQYPGSELRLMNDTDTKKETTPLRKSRKSPGLAFIYSLLIPGLGHVYADNFKTGKYFMISEAALWVSFAAFTFYGNWLLDDAYSYSVNHAGVSLSGKERDEKYFTDIANYSNIYEYNDEKLRFGEYEAMYDPSTHYFYWDNNENRLRYREDKIAGDRTLNDRLFVLGAVVINHIVSAISAVFVTNSYNSEIGKKPNSGGLTFNTKLLKHRNRIDGIALKMIKYF